MKTQYTIWCVVIVMVFATLPCGAQDHLVFSRPENRSGVALLMGERVLKEAYARLGIDFEFRELPEVRAMVTANEGGTDGEFERFAGLEQTYPNLVMIPVPIGSVDIVVYTKETDFAVEGWHSLAPYTIGIVRGFKLIEANTEGMHVEAVTTVEQAFLKLNAGRSDVVVESRSAQCMLKDFNVSGIRVLEPPLDQLVLYHYLHRRHTALAAKLEAVLTRMEQEGELKALQEQAMQDFLESCGQ
jgi:polar amino acid transport system substrate-binding protein